jgi:hypothetical protein
VDQTLIECCSSLGPAGMACKLRGEGLIGCRACQVICDRTHPVMKNSLGVLTELDRTPSRAASCALRRRVRSMVESVLTDFVTVGNQHAKFKTMTRGAIWGPNAGGLRPINSTDASGRPKAGCFESPTTLFLWGLYK